MADLDSFLSSITEKDNALRKTTPKAAPPPPRSSRRAATSTSASATSSRAAPPLKNQENNEVSKSGDDAQDKKGQFWGRKDYYREWDKFDINAAIKEIDEVEQHAKSKRVKPVKLTPEAAYAGELRTDLMSETEKEVVANEEKQKGNECFKAGDFEGAVNHYSRCIKCQPKNAAALSNRAQAFINVAKKANVGSSRWRNSLEQATADASECLKLQDSITKGSIGVKALNRRGIARRMLGRLTDAKSDFDEILKVEPGNKDVARERKETEKLIEKSLQTEKELRDNEGSKKEVRKRITIEEASSDEEEEEEEAESSVHLRSSETPVAEVPKPEQMAAPQSSPASAKPQVPAQQQGNAECVALPEKVRRSKEEGNTSFQQGDHSAALRFYESALEGAADATKQHKQKPLSRELLDAVASCYNNMALVNIQRENSEAVIQETSRCLALVGSRGDAAAKSFVRRSRAREAMEQYDGALADLNKAMPLMGSKKDSILGSYGRLSKDVRRSQAAQEQEAEERRKKFGDSCEDVAANDLVKAEELLGNADLTHFLEDVWKGRELSNFSKVFEEQGCVHAAMLVGKFPMDHEQKTTCLRAGKLASKAGKLYSSFRAHKLASSCLLLTGRFHLAEAEARSARRKAKTSRDRASAYAIEAVCQLHSGSIESALSAASEGLSSAEDVLKGTLQSFVVSCEKLLQLTGRGAVVSAQTEQPKGQIDEDSARSVEEKKEEVAIEVEKINSADAVGKEESTVPPTGTSAVMSGPAMAERLKEADLLKEEGNRLFKKSDFSGAVRLFSKALSLANIPAYYSNRCLAYQRMGEFDKALRDADSALKLLKEDSTNTSSTVVKALYRRATTLKELGRIAETRKAIVEGLSLEPQNASLVALEKSLLEIYPDAVTGRTSGVAHATSEIKTEAAQKATGELKQSSARQEALKEETQPSKVQPAATSSVSPRASSDGPLEQKAASDASSKPVGTPGTGAEESGLPSAKASRAMEKTTPIRTFKMGAQLPKKPPTSGYEFEKDWKNLKKDSAKFAEYLRMIPLHQYGKLLKNKLSDDIVDSIVEALSTNYTGHEEEAVKTLLELKNNVDQAGMFFDLKYMSPTQSQGVLDVISSAAEANVDLELVADAMTAFGVEG